MEYLYLFKILSSFWAFVNSIEEVAEEKNKVIFFLNFNVLKFKFFAQQLYSKENVGKVKVENGESEEKESEKEEESEEEKEESEEKEENEEENEEYNEEIKAARNILLDYSVYSIFAEYLCSEDLRNLSRCMEFEIDEHIWTRKEGDSRGKQSYLSSDL